MHRYAISEAKGAGRSPSYCAHWGSLAPGLAVPMQRMAGSDGPNGPGDKGLRGAVQGVDFADAGSSLGTVCRLFAVQCKEDISSHGSMSQFSKIIVMFLFAATLHQAAWAQDGISAHLA